MKIFYYTSTGNCLYVAKRMQEKIENCELISITKAIKSENFKINDDIVGLIYTIHYAGVPIHVYDFISKIKITKNAYVFAVGVSGGGSADTSFYQLENLMKREIDNCLTVKYISNYIRVGTNPTKERALKAIGKYEEEIDKFIESIKRKEIKHMEFKKGIGNLEYNIFKNVLKNKDKNFNVNDSCIGCTMCQKICPVDNIVFDDNKPKWLGKCVDCMGCINICPKEAINIGKRTIMKNRYRNPYIKSQELI